MTPSGTRIYVVHIKYQQNRSWQEAINVAGPNTPSDHNVRKVEGFYPATGIETIEEDLILLNYPSGDGNWDKALSWAQGAKLKNTVPREVFAVGEQHPNLHRTFGQNPTMYVVATTDCTFETTVVGLVASGGMARFAGRTCTGPAPSTTPMTGLRFSSKKIRFPGRALSCARPFSLHRN